MLWKKSVAAHFTNQRGMTLVEIMIVIGILASLLVILGNTVVGQLQKAQMKQAKIQIGELSKALEMYYNDCYKFPDSSVGLQALLSEEGTNCSNWGPTPYVKKAMLRDPWDNEFVYESDGSSFVITSLGSDGREGGSGTEKDVSSED